MKQVNAYGADQSVQFDQGAEARMPSLASHLIPKPYKEFLYQYVTPDDR